MKRLTTFLTLTFTFLWVATAIGAPASELVVYSARSKTLTRIPFNQHFRDTGVRVKLVNGKINELFKKLQNEGSSSPADILLTVDAGSLWRAEAEGLLQPVQSDILTKNIPAHLRDKDNTWFGLSKRARTIVYSTDRVKPGDLSTYEDLADPKWKGRLCLRTAKKVYNQSLVAMMIKQHGREKTEQLVEGWVANLAEPPFAKDNGVILAIAENKCDVGIVNHYYFGRLIKADPNKPVALFWPNQKKGQGGVYVDIAGAGVLKTSKNKEEAIKFLEWLSSEEAQNLFADSNMEYPVNPRVKPNEQVQAWGTFQPNLDNISHSGENRGAAIELMEKAGYQ